jgi:hypothetical protein
LADRFAQLRSGAGSGPRVGLNRAGPQTVEAATAGGVGPGAADHTPPIQADRVARGEGQGPSSLKLVAASLGPRLQRPEGYVLYEGEAEADEAGGEALGRVASVLGIPPGRGRRGAHVRTKPISWEE